MVRRTIPCLVTAILFVTLSASATSPAQQVQQGAQLSQEDGMRIVGEVRKALLGLTNYGVFDWITFGFRGTTLVLNGYASRPTLKDDAGRAVKNIKGISGVDNQIKVLPFSPNDDRIRAAVYNRIYTQPALRKYNANQGSLAQALGPGGRSFTMMSGGITNNPPIGYHAIHIIVNNGNVILTGVVDSKTDADVASIQANSTPGVFSVDNDLQIAGNGKQGGH